MKNIVDSPFLILYIFNQEEGNVADQKRKEKVMNWNIDSQEGARISISDCTETVYVSEDQLPEEFTLREIADEYARTYDHNGNDESFAVCIIEDMEDGEEHTFAFDGHGNFEWNTRRQFVSC